MAVIDKGNGVKVAVTGQSFEDEIMWRAAVYNQLASINNKFTWILILMLAVAGLSFIAALM